VVGPVASLVAVAGEDLILPCFIKLNTSVVDMTVEWFKLDKNNPLVHLYKDHEDRNEDQALPYRERTSLFKEELQKGNASLKLSALRVSDEGKYKCFIQDKSQSDDIIVNVIVEEILEVVGPAASLVVVAGEDLILPCFIKSKISAVDMRVEWFKLDVEDSLVHLYEEHEDRNKNQAPSYRKRTSLLKEELQKGNASLKLSALRVSDEGEYKCFIADKSQSDDITVNVIVEEILEVVGPAAPLVAVAGKDLILPCFIKSNTSAVDMRVEWFKLDVKDSLVHLYEDHEDRNKNQAPSYRKRTSLFKEELQKGNASLKLSPLRVSDEGEYKC
ncbi:butyrophilin-like protein 2, partial [Silurus meridionalis]